MLLYSGHLSRGWGWSLVNYSSYKPGAPRVKPEFCLKSDSLTQILYTVIVLHWSFKKKSNLSLDHYIIMFRSEVMWLGNHPDEIQLGIQSWTVSQPNSSPRKHFLNKEQQIISLEIPMLPRALVLISHLCLDSLPSLETFKRKIMCTQRNVLVSDHVPHMLPFTSYFDLRM